MHSYQQFASANRRHWNFLESNIVYAAVDCSLHDCRNCTRAENIANLRRYRHGSFKLCLETHPPAVIYDSRSIRCCSASHSFNDAALAFAFSSRTLLHQPGCSARYIANRPVSNLPSFETNLPTGGITKSSSSEIAFNTAKFIPSARATRATADASISTASACHRSASNRLSDGPLTAETVATLPS